MLKSILSLKMRLLLQGFLFVANSLRHAKIFQEKNLVYQTENILFFLSVVHSVQSRLMMQCLIFFLKAQITINITIFIQSELTAVNFLKNSKKRRRYNIIYRAPPFS